VLEKIRGGVRPLLLEPQSELGRGELAVPVGVHYLEDVYRLAMLEPLARPYSGKLNLEPERGVRGDRREVRAHLLVPVGELWGNDDRTIFANAHALDPLVQPLEQRVLTKNGLHLSARVVLCELDPRLLDPARQYEGGGLAVLQLPHLYTTVGLRD